MRFLLLALSLLVSCATTKAIAVQTGACVLGNLPSDVTSAIPAVTSIITSNANDADVESQLDGLGEQLGVQVVTCAVEAVIDTLFKSMPTTATNASIDQYKLLQLKRCQAYLVAHHTDVKK